jgi:hypothetical protein
LCDADDSAAAHTYGAAAAYANTDQRVLSY